MTRSAPAASAANASRSRRPPIISLFSGGGGFDLGLEQAGFSTRAMVEIELHACATLRANRDKKVEVAPSHTYLQDAQIIERDIRKVPGAEVLREADLRPGEALVLAGGPPCITFSVAGRRAGLGDGAGMLFEQYARILRVAKPRALLFENVKGLLNAPDGEGRPGGAFKAIVETLCDAGYSLTWDVVNAADYGVPQQRERLIIVGRRGTDFYHLPPPTHYDPERPPQLRPPSMEPWRDVRDAIGDLPRAVPQGEQPLAPNHVARAHTPAVVESLKATAPGQRNAMYKRDRLRWDRPSKVIRAQGKQKPDGSGRDTAPTSQSTPRNTAS